MTRRKRGTGRSLESVVEQLPQRFLHIDVAFSDGSMRELNIYIHSLRSYLSAELGREVETSTALEVMEQLGIGPRRWYEAAFAEDARRYRRLHGIPEPGSSE